MQHHQVSASKVLTTSFLQGQVTCVASLHGLWRPGLLNCATSTFLSSILRCKTATWHWPWTGLRTRMNDMPGHCCVYATWTYLCLVPSNAQSKNAKSQIDAQPVPEHDHLQQMWSHWLSSHCHLKLSAPANCGHVSRLPMGSRVVMCITEARLGLASQCGVVRASSR